MNIHFCSENPCPQQDKEAAELLENGFTTNYINFNPMEIYILKKDTPRSKANDKFYAKEVIGCNYIVCERTSETFPLTEITNFSEWFEKKRWTPKYDEQFYYTCDNGQQSFSFWIGSELQKKLWEIGNCFQTSEEEREMAEKVKKLRLGIAD